jgi:hypothetical protein
MAGETEDDALLFDVMTPLGFSVRVTRAHWALITTVKHPVMRDRQAAVEESLAKPDEVRVSRVDSSVYLFYRLERERRWVCAVAKQPNGDGFLITAYPTDAIKEGETVWPK